MMDAFWAVPEWAPVDESHLLGSLSAVTKITYGAGAVTYSTFDADSTDVLRLDFVPEFVTVGGKAISRRKDLSEEGYIFDDAKHTMSVRHTSAKEVDIQGKGGSRPPSYISFDDPHLAAGTELDGQYPAGLIDWGREEWAIGTPYGKFGTFTLVPSDSQKGHSGFRFAMPLIFVGIDVYNDGEHEVTMLVRSPENREVSFTIRPKELQRVKTGWRDPSSRVDFRFANPQTLRFDNLAYLRP